MTSAIENVQVHDKLTRELRESVRVQREYVADRTTTDVHQGIGTVVVPLAALIEHDSRTMTARDFGDLYGTPEQDIRRAVRKWAREH